MQLETRTNSLPFVELNGNKRIYEKYIKRVIDLGLSLCALIILAPIVCILAVLVKVKLGSPVLFRQQRIGKGQKVFSIYKFRTMTDEKDDSGNLLPDSKRLTRFGKLLRSTSLDELPGLINILKGEMSIVGPRPLPTIYLPYYTEDEQKRHTVRAGLTGLAQVSGRNMLRWEEKFKYDLQYVNNITFMGDVKIILATAIKVFRKQDIVSSDVVIIDGYELRPLHIERAQYIEGE